MPKRSRVEDSADEDFSEGCTEGGSDGNCSEDYVPSSSDDGEPAGSPARATKSPADRIKQLEKENAALKRKLQSSTGKRQRGAAAEEQQSSDPAAVQAMVEKMRKSIAKQCEAVMVYKKSMRRGGGGGRINIQVPNLTSQQVSALLGDAVATSNGPKQMVAKVSNDQLYEVLGRGVSKSLRYGAILSPREGLKFTFSKADGMLTISGTYGMY